jgi:Arc/MetJ family transcription regulator
MHMKRTNLVLDEQLLEEVTRVSGERTYSRAVTRAIEDYLRRHRAGRILELAGTGLWEGDQLAAQLEIAERVMREDRDVLRKLAE